MAQSYLNIDVAGVRAEDDGERLQLPVFPDETRRRRRTLVGTGGGKGESNVVPLLEIRWMKFFTLLSSVHSIPLTHSLPKNSQTSCSMELSLFLRLSHSPPISSACLSLSHTHSQKGNKCWLELTGRRIIIRVASSSSSPQIRFLSTCHCINWEMNAGQKSNPLYLPSSHSLQSSKSRLSN